MIRNYIKGILIKALKKLEGEKVAFYLTILSVESTYILYRNDFIFDNWDNEIILTKEIIENLLDK